MELSIVLPCLNEADTLEKCILKAKSQINKNKIKGEIIISDNGSTDGSIEIARNNNVHIINVKEKGYGNAVRAGISAANGEYVLVADADDSYDLNEIPRFLKKAKMGFDLIQGCRFPSGGGNIEKNAMPISHRLFGNPFFTKISKLFYGLKYNDVYCGMKIIRKNFYNKLTFFSKGMIFCLEILIKFKVANARTDEIPITLYKDGRIKGSSHLKTVTDGIRTLKFILICCPKWFFFIPGSLMLLYSLLNLFISVIANKAGISTVNILEFGTFFIIGVQIIMLGLFSTIIAENLGVLKKNNLKGFFNIFTLKKSLLLNLIFLIVVYFLEFNGTTIYEKEIDDILFSFSKILSITIIFNSFFVSLLRIQD